MNIPHEAIEAARVVAWERYGSRPDAAYLRTLLSAAAPHLMAELRLELARLAKEFDTAEGGTLAYTVAHNGQHLMRKNAHDQLMYIIDNYLTNPHRSTGVGE